MTSSRSSKYLKTTFELKFTTQKTNGCSPWNAGSVFNWKHLFWVNLVQKLKTINLSWNFVPRLIKICRIPWWCSLFLFSTVKSFLGKYGLKNENCQFELKFRTRLIGICRILYKLCGLHISYFRPGKLYLDKFVQNNQNCQLKQKFSTKWLIWMCRIHWWC